MSWSTCITLTSFKTVSVDFVPVDYLTCHFCRNLTLFVFILVTLLICTLLLLFPFLLDQGTVRHVRLDNNILFILIGTVLVKILLSMRKKW